LRIPQGVQQTKENQRNECNIYDTQPVNALEYEKEIVEEFSHDVIMIFVQLSADAGQRPDDQRALGDTQSANS
jgi:hypothetical protein